LRPFGFAQDMLSASHLCPIRFFKKNASFKYIG
jgi:hypothetical protein